jgi:hypothetical protein
MLTMYDVPFLCERYGLTVKQVRDRLTALSPALTAHLLQGKHGAKVLTDGGLAIFDRLMQLERGGLSVSAAAEKIQEECSPGVTSPTSTSVSPPSANGESLVIELLTRQVEDLRQERDRLLAMLEGKDEQLRALMPGPASETTPFQGSGERVRLSRWQAFKVLVLGRA